LDPAQLDDPVLKTDPVGRAASQISVFPAVRAALVAFQRDFARQPPGAVLDGRDIGTVICPDADVKIFVIADPRVRAARRYRELIGRGEAADEAAVLADIEARDARDRNRVLAPLKPAPDAHSLDTSALDIDAAVAAAIAIVERRRATSH
ncbi:MAG: (d)CMP kinase, partial [Xanthobacteraceae bacterium]